MSLPIAPAPLPGDVDQAALLRGVLDVSLTALQLLRPLYAPDGAAIVDFTPEYTNPAGLRMLGFAQQPSGTMLSLFPHTLANGILAYYVRAFAASEVLAYELNYQADGLDNYFRVQAQRQGPLLLVSFTDTSDQPRSAVELALRESQAAEQAARAETERQRQRFYDLLMQLPAQVAVHEGADQVFTLVNPGYQRLAPGRTLQGQPIREAWPELVGQGILDVLDGVYQTGEPFIGKELPFQVDFTRTGTVEQVYFDAFFLPLRDAQGRVSGVLDFSYDVTGQVLARRQAEQLNQQLDAARLAAERERAQLQALLAQAPVAIALFQGDDLRVAAATAEMATIWGDYTPAQVMGRPLLEGVPALQGQGFDDLLRQVLHTQEPVSGTETPAQLLRNGQLQTSYYNFVYQPFYDAEGQVLGVIDVALDVTEQVVARQQVEQLNAELEARVQERTQAAQQARARAERERSLLEAILTQAPVAIAVFQGEELRITAANPQMAALWGSTPEQVLNLPFMDAVPELRGQGFDEQMRQVLRTQVPVRGLATPATMQRDGRLQTTYYDFVYQPLYDPEGQLLGAIDVAVEVTEQVLARQQVLALNEELKARVAERSRQLAQHQSLFQQILQQLPAAVGAFEGPSHRYSFFNDHYQQLSGNRLVLGSTVAELFPELAEQGFVALLDQVRATGQPFVAFEAPAHLDDPTTGESTQYYLDIVYQPLLDDQQQVTSILAFLLDVTEKVTARRQVEQLNQELETRVQERTRELAQAQAEADTQRYRLHRLVSEAPALIASLRGPEHVVELANDGFRAIFGGRDLVGKTYREAIPEFEGQPFFDLLDNVYRTGETYYGIDELVMLDRTNSGQLENTFLTFTYQATRDAQGQIDGILVFCYEVTDQVLARQEREAQRGELQRLFEQAPVAVAVFRGPQYVIELANPSVCALWGRTPQQAVGTLLFELLPEAAGQGFEQLLDQVRATGVPFVAHELPSPIDRNGRRETVYWNFVYAPLREADGTIERVIVVATDGTEQVLARQQILALNETLTATNEELGDSNLQLTRTNVDLDNFIYTASHDLKAPITNIEGLLLALEEELPAAGRTGDVPLMLTMMQDAIDRFRQTIAHLTDLSRLQKENSPDVAVVALAPVVEAVRLDITPLLLQTQGQLTVSIPEGLTVTFAEKNLRSVVYNLLSNAFKYRHPDRVPQVRLRSRLADEYVLLEVQDNGLGLDLTQGQERLFGMFQRLHTHVEGTGVGLYMVKRILENAGGRIEVSSELGEGTTFRVFFRR